ncbi:hypothetical protein A4G19_07100 [Pasteurellaceae bacterium Macca]|nr:hypothetical protein [Pasteurellaceae bacterium Macca]
MMTLDEYKMYLKDEIKNIASLEMISEKEAFINYFSDILNIAEEIDDKIQYVSFESIGKFRQKIQIDGYYYNELDNELSFYITLLPLGDNENLTATEADKLFSRAKAFLEDIDFILSNTEESSPAYGLAIDISEKYSNVKAYNIYLISDRLISRTIQSIETNYIKNTLVKFHIWDLNRLYKIEESQTGKEDIVIDLLNFTNKIGIPCLPIGKNSSYESYLCSISGHLLANLYNTYGGRLLEGNVRSFLQTKGKVNKGIRNTILHNPEMFFAYNNGIAATAYSIKKEIRNSGTYLTEITDLQIVNGGQTTASLAMALLNDKKDNSEENIKQIYVPMKLSIVSQENSENLIQDISRYANSQNKVSEADLWSNHPFHIRIEEISRRVIAPAKYGEQYGTYWYYERANGQYKQETYKSTDSIKKRFMKEHPKSQVITKTELAKYMNIKNTLPHIASLGSQASFSKFAGKISKEWEKDNTLFNEGYFKNLVSIAILFREADKSVKSEEWYNSYKANIVAYTLSKIIYTVKENYSNKDIDFKLVWQKQGLTAGWAKQIRDLSRIMNDYLTDKNRDIINVTEWAKKEKCWDGAKNLKIELCQEFINELIYKEHIDILEKEERKTQDLTNNLNLIIEAYNYGVENWERLLQWDKDNKILSENEIQNIKNAISLTQNKKSISSQKQASLIMKALNRAINEGYLK